MLKLVVALAVMLHQCEWHVSSWLATLRKDVLGSLSEVAKLSVPSVVYIVQNNLLYLAIANLDAPTYQVVYNAKILTTGLFAVLLLGRRLSPIQWFSLLLLMAGLSLAQYSPSSSAVQGSRLLGLSAVAIACVTSGFAGVYFEKVLKGSPQTSLWIRNVQMSTTSVPLALLSAYWNDGAQIADNGFNYGYTWLVWCIIVNQAVGGLLIALVMKYADNLLKAFAAAISILSSSIIAAVFFDFQITPQFVLGAIVVLSSTYIYSVPETINNYVPSFCREQPKTPLPI